MNDEEVKIGDSTFKGVPVHFHMVINHGITC